MAAKTVLVLCAQALLIQSIFAQCLGGAYPALAAAPYTAASFGAAPLAAPLAAPCGAWNPVAELAASNGPGLAVTSASPIPPVGVSVTSDNAIEGALAIGGAVPFLGSVGLEGAVPTAGAGAISYNCGNGLVSITAEDTAVAPLGYASGPFAASLGLAGPLSAPLAYEAPYAGCGYRGII